MTTDGAAYSRFPAGARVSLPRIAGHRDADSTDCPGDALYGQLTGARHGAARLAGSPCRLTLQALIGAGGLPAGVLGSLHRLDGTPVEGAPVAIQQRLVARRGQSVSERTLAQTLSATDGSFSVPFAAFTPAHGKHGPFVALRAVCAGAAGLPASVSDPLELDGSASFAPPPPPPSSTPPASPPNGAAARARVR